MTMMTNNNDNNNNNYNINKDDIQKLYDVTNKLLDIAKHNQLFYDITKRLKRTRIFLRLWDISFYMPMLVSFTIMVFILFLDGTAHNFNVPFWFCISVAFFLIGCIVNVLGNYFIDKYMHHTDELFVEFKKYSNKIKL
jgi:hypothetical protein